MADDMLSDQNTIARNNAYSGPRVILCPSWPQPEDQTMNDAKLSNISTRTVFPLDAKDEYPVTPLFDAHTDRAVREDKAFYIPDLLSDKEYDANPAAYTAFAKQAKQLHKTEGLLDDAWNLVQLMLTAIGDEGDDRAMQTEAGLKVIEKKLSKAHAQIDKHHTGYSNLFFAYFDLMDKSEEGAE